MGAGLTGGPLTGGPAAAPSLLPGATGTDLTLTGDITAADFIPSPVKVPPTNGMYLAAAGVLGFASNGVNVVRVGSGIGLAAQLNTYYAFYLTGTSAGLGGVGTVRLTSEMADAAGAVAVTSNTTTAWSTVGAKIHSFRTNQTEVGAIGFRGTLYSGAAAIPDDTGTPGNVTQNAPRGRAAMAAAATTCTITNDQCTANSVVHVVWEGDPTGTRTWVVVNAGNFVVTLSAAPAGNVNFRWFIVN